MPILTHSFVTLEELDAEVKQVIKQLGPDVVRVNYNVGEDTTGDVSLHFRIVITDAAARRETLASATRSIRDTVNERLAPMARWGLFPYFSFRSESEQAERSEPEWS